MAANASKRIVIFGGNGFLGSRICKSAVARGWDVTSVSRSGEPQWQSVTSSPQPPSWAHKVSWERGDILKPVTYTSLLQSADYVVHSMGILLEADYKGVISGKESPVAGLKRAFSSTKQGSKNPLKRQGDEDLKPQEPDGQITYELINRDSAIKLAQHANEAKVNAFGYVSAAAGAPILPARYITTKREAEAAIASNFLDMRNVFIRPSFLYDSSRTFTIPMAGLAWGGTIFNKATGGIFGGLMGSGGIKPLAADVVAQAMVEGLSDENINGPIEVPVIETLAEKSWRKEML